MKTFVFIYTAIVALTSFSSIEAQEKDPDLPEFQYNLIEKPESERVSLCEQNKGYCQTDCGGPDKDPMNFCNSTTMGWGCGCIDKIPDYFGFQWPINFAHCIGSGEACKDACQGTKVPAQSKPKCNEACFRVYSQTCGTPKQPPAYYNVSDIAEVPAYAPPDENAKGSNGKSPSTSPSTDGKDDNNSTSTSSDEKKSDASSLGFHIGNAVFTLVIVASGMSLL